MGQCHCGICQWCKPHYCGGIHPQESSCFIPDAPYYVLSHDTFMSQWGGAWDKANICVVPCNNQEEAHIVAVYVRSRSDQKNVKVVTGKPRERGRLLSNLSSWRKFAQEKAELDRGVTAVIPIVL